MLHTLTQVWEWLAAALCCLHAACPLLAGWCTVQSSSDATLCQAADTVCGLCGSMAPAPKACPHTLRMMTRQHAAADCPSSGQVVGLVKLGTCCNIPETLEAARGWQRASTRSMSCLVLSLYHVTSGDASEPCLHLSCSQGRHWILHGWQACHIAPLRWHPVAACVTAPVLKHHKKSLSAGVSTICVQLAAVVAECWKPQKGWGKT